MPIQNYFSLTIGRKDGSCLIYPSFKLIEIFQSEAESGVTALTLVNELLSPSPFISVRLINKSLLINE